MYAELNADLLTALDRPDLRVVSAARRVSFDASLDAPFRADAKGEVQLGPACLGSARACAFHIRHALELSMLLEVAAQMACGSGEPGRHDLPVLAGLCAARTAALFWRLDGPETMEPVSWCSAMAEATPPSREELDLVWQTLRALQPAGTDPLSHEVGRIADAVVRRLGEIWDVLGPAEALMARGGDARLAVDPRSGLNHYGCSHRPRPWAVTFASSTASSLSERGFGGAEASRRRIAAAALAGQEDAAAEIEACSVRRGIAAHYGLPAGSEVVLAASGTDCELLALALTRQDAPVSTILTAPEETGTGVPLAAGGMHFAADTSGRHQVRKGEPIAGFRADTRVLPLAVRRTDGSVRSADEIETECAALTQAECSAGRHVLLHLLDLSKTGLLAPRLACLERLQARHGDGVSVVVDACQARLHQRRVRDYVARGWMVMVTGSKFFTGPPFCGAVLLPPAIAARLSRSRLPAGLSAYGNVSDWPDCAAASHLPREVNLGMVLRWQAALAEMEAFASVPDRQVHARLDFFLSGVRDAIASNPDLVLIEVPAPDRAQANAATPMEPCWDALQTIISFLVLDPGPRRDLPLTLERARMLYRWLNADVADALPPKATETERHLGRLLCHLGQPAPIPHHALDGGSAGAMRISAGARLLSGEPSHQRLDVEHRLAREIADARRALLKVSLLLRYWADLEAGNPQPSYAPKP